LSSDVLDMLVLEGLTSSSTARNLRSKVQEAWLPLGKILRQRGRLTMEQMMRLLVMQTTETNLRFGELAVREGYCTADDIEEALRLQRDTSPHALEVFLADVPCDREQVIQFMIRYIRHLEARTAASPLRTEKAAS
jgi:hypothetical protein